MALQYVGGTSYTENTDDTPNVSLTGLTGGLSSSPAAGDIVVVAMSATGSGDKALAFVTTGYTVIAELNSADTEDTNLLVGYKVMGGTPDTAVDLSHDAGGGSATAVHVWRNINATPLDVTSTTATGIDTGRPDPPSITPTTSGAVVIVVGGSDTTGDDTASPLAQSGSELSNFIAASKNISTTRTAHVAMGSYAWTSGAFDPAAFVGADTSVTSSWAAVSVALRPLAGQFLTLSLGTNPQTFPAPKGSHRLPASLFTNTNVFHAATVSSTYALTPALVTNTETFYAPTVTNTFGLYPSLLTNTQTFIRTNLLLRSQELDNAWWLKTAGGTGTTPVVTADYGTATDGTLTAERVELSSGGSGQSQLASSSVTTVTGTTYTFSVWAKSLGGTVSVSMFGVAGVETISVTSAWQRFTRTTTATGTGSEVRLAKREVWGTGGTADLLVWGMQLEAGSNVSDYIPTTSATASGYLATVSPGEVFVQPNLFTNTETFYGPTVTTIYRLAAGYWDNTQTFYGPQANLVIFPSLLSTPSDFYAATVTTHNDIVVDLFTNTQTFYDPVLVSTYPLTPPILRNYNQIFPARLDPPALDTLPVSEFTLGKPFPLRRLNKRTYVRSS